MSRTPKLCEHESIDWILKKLPKFSKSFFSKKIDIIVTSFDVNKDVIVIGSQMGYLYYIIRENSEIFPLLLKKDTSLCQIKLIKTINLSVAVGLDNGSVFILKFPMKNQINFDEVNQFSLPVDHNAAITCITWSKNSEKLFTGDNNGHIWCTEVNDMNKTVSSYHILDAVSQITELSYDHKCLIISNEIESFIYNLSTNSIVKFGSKPRNQIGQFGGCFLEKLCKPNEVEIAIIRPNSKVWISDLNGIIKKTIVLNNDSLFSFEKSISLLPCVTSQSKTKYIEEIQSGIRKYQLGLVTPTNENEILFWSRNGLILFDLSVGKVVSSTYNLGSIISVSVCYVNILIPFNAISESNFNYELLEIWILRKPIRAEDNSFVRLSMLPLITSKLTINTFYGLSNYPNYENKFINEIPNVNQSESTISEPTAGLIDENLSLNMTEKWLPKLEVNVVDTFQEITKKTKEILKQGQEMFDNVNEGVEQALELTEEGLIIEFDGNYDNYNTSNVVFNSSLKIENSMTNDLTKSHIKHERNINFVDLDIINFRDVSTEKLLLEEKYSIPDKLQNETDVSTEKLLLEEKYSIPDKLQNETGESTEKLLFEEKYTISDKLQNEIEERRGSSDDEESDILKCCNLYEEISPIQKTITEQDLFFDSNQQVEADPLIILDSSKECKPNIDIDYVQELTCIDVDMDQNMESKPFTFTQHSLYEFTCKNDPSKESFISDKFEETADKIIVTEKLKLTNHIISNSNKWITHRGPLLSGYNKIVSLSINRRMIWIIDALGTIHVGFQCLENQNSHSTEKLQLTWYQNNILQTDRIFSSPEGVILWRDKCGEILVYTGVTKIWTQKVVQEKVLLKSNWEKTMCKIKNIDIDNDMAVIVTTKGQLKVMNGISGRISYKQSSTASITGHVTLATILNGIIWCVTEIVDPETKKTSQHIFACASKDEDNNLNLSYWRTVPIPKDLISEKEEHLGILGGTTQIKCIQLGTYNLAWVITYYNSCFFTINVTLDNATGDGVWYQISLNFLFQNPSINDEARSKRTYSNNIQPSVLISVKAVPKKSIGNGILWITNTEKNSPCILFESHKDILGHCWIDRFSVEFRRNSINSLPPMLTWSSVTYGFKNVLWLINNSNEMYCYWQETRIRNIVVSSFFGKVIQIAAYGCIVIALTATYHVLLRIGITSDNPIGTDWINLSNSWKIKKDDKEFKQIKYISCFKNELWIITNENVFYIDDFLSSMYNNSKKFTLKLFEFNLIDSITNSFSSIQVATEFLGKKYIWSISDPDGYVYLGIWDISKNLFNWTYIPGPKAKSLHISDESLWMVEQISGEIYVRCGINFEYKASGDYWIHIPLSTTPVKSVSVSLNNNIVLIDSKERLLSHKWTVVKGKEAEEISSIKQHDTCSEGDWELLN